MNADDLPTKKNLLAAKHNLTLARKGNDLLEMKYNALSREFKRINGIINEIYENLQVIISKAERILMTAKAEKGERFVSALWEQISWDTQIMPPFDLNNTCVALDEAFFLWNEVLSEKKKLSEHEETLAHLKIRVKRTRKRSAALRNIVIPMYETRIKYISSRLEEHERDERTRLKVAGNEK